MLRSSFAALLLLVFFFNVARGAPENEHVRITPTPAWLDAADRPEFDTPPPAKNPGGWHFLLFDRRFHTEQAETFSHFAYRLTNSSALQDGARISIDYDPEYERIDFHFIRVVRAGKATDRLSLSAIKTIQQERDLDRHLYNGQFTALVMLDDIRIDDVVEYAYTRRGRNPVYAGHFNETVPVRWSTPIHKLRVSVFSGPERSVSAKLHGSADLNNEVFTHGSLVEQRWSASRLPAVEPDSELPDWYSPHAFLQFTDHTSWADVLAWAQPLYDLPVRLSPELEQKADELCAALKKNEERARAILDFVQREIRYLGIELGPKSHRPSPPAEVLNRRFGDCKDKSLLLCALLKRAGIRAFPALTHSTRSHVMRDWLPSPAVFDHVIACIQIGGSSYWVDPTISEQAGTLSTRSIPDYRFALPIASNITQLEPVLLNPDARPSIQVEEYYDASSFDAPSKLEVRSHYSGSIANSMRRYLRDTPVDQISKNYLNTRLRLEPGIAVEGEPSWTENTRLNSITVIHRYTLPCMWQKSKGSTLLQLEVYPAMIRDYTEPPDSPKRTMPLAVTHPFRVSQETTVRLPHAWPDENTSERIDDPAFTAEASRTTRGASAKTTYTWESKRDHVPVEQVARYAEKIREFRDQLGSTLTYDPEIAARNKHFRLYWPLAGSLLGAGLLTGAGLWWWAKRESARPSDVPPPPLSTHLYGLGGWLILVGFGLFLRPIQEAITFFPDYGLFFDARTTENLTRPESENYIAGVATLLCVETAAHLALFITSIALIVLFLKKKRLFPTAFIAWFLATLAFSIGDLIAAEMIFGEDHDSADSIKELVRLGIACAIWIPYMRVSRRVRTTFIH